MYEGTRSARTGDIASIEKLLRPLEESGILVNRPRKQVCPRLYFFTSRETKQAHIICSNGIIACGLLRNYDENYIIVQCYINFHPQSILQLSICCLFLDPLPSLQAHMFRLGYELPIFFK
jgi:N-acetylglutamate synthase-like GNAT family acetyltransferase